MAATATGERPVKLSVLARELGVARRTLHRWCVDGLATSTGERVYLKAERVGKLLLARRSDLRRFQQSVDSASA